MLAKLIAVSPNFSDLSKLGSQCIKNVSQTTEAVGEKNGDSLNLIKNIVTCFAVFYNLNNNIKLPLFESSGVSEVRSIYVRFFVFHMNLAIQEVRTTLDDSIISIKKTSLSNTLWNSHYKGC